MATKEEKYTSLLRAAQSLLSGERDYIAKMANLAALLHHEFGFWWTGFYRVSGNELILGPFQGPLACMHIGYGKGVCGTAWAEQRTVVVPDVEQFPGHIACSSESKSEIVVPVRKNGTIVAVLDIDSRELNTFDDTDRVFLEQLTQLLHPEEAEIWFAAGCFWGAQKFFKMVEGVISTEVGFANGDTQDPSYQEVYTDTTGHAECVHVVYQPDVVSLRELTELYFQIIDPLSLNQQGEDVGTRYRTGVYFNRTEDAEILKEIFEEQQAKFGENLAVELLPLKCFYPAEEYHQDYLDKNPNGYCHLGPAVFELARRWRKLK
ncbi:MAG: peptide-methionine (S)-S-oxide reductase MsrA [Bacteroidales bacterium]|nr:peptide-methionine (S)-S-oxide reductase MsrA [Bacteroidales bacterium]